MPVSEMCSTGISFFVREMFKVRDCSCRNPFPAWWLRSGRHDRAQRRGQSVLDGDAFFRPVRRQGRSLPFAMTGSMANGLKMS